MNIINIEHISKVYGEKVIFDDASYGIQEGDKIGIIGINGTGKTTLLNMIAGREETDSGSIIRQNGLHMAYLSQNPAYEKEDTVLSFADARDRSVGLDGDQRGKEQSDDTRPYQLRGEAGASLRRTAQEGGARKGTAWFF